LHSSANLPSGTAQDDLALHPNDGLIWIDACSLRFLDTPVNPGKSPL